MHPLSTGGSSKIEMKEMCVKQNIGQGGGTSAFEGLWSSHGKDVWAGVCQAFAPHNSECVCFIGGLQPQGASGHAGPLLHPDSVPCLSCCSLLSFRYLNTFSPRLPAGSQRHTLFLLSLGEGTGSNRRTAGPSDISSKRQRHGLGPATCLSDQCVLGLLSVTSPP